MEPAAEPADEPAEPTDAQHGVLADELAARRARR